MGARYLADLFYHSKPTFEKHNPNMRWERDNSDESFEYLRN